MAKQKVLVQAEILDQEETLPGVMRLNANLRRQLEDLFGEHVGLPELQKLEDELYEQAHPIVLAAVYKKYPPIDMQILKKYEVSFEDRCVKVMLSNGLIILFHFRENQAPLVVQKTFHGGPVFSIPNEKDSNVIDAWNEVYSEHERRKKELHQDFRTLLDTAKTLEQIITVWPMAEQVRPKESAGRLIDPKSLERLKEFSKLTSK